jgi:hypothetical protein
MTRKELMFVLTILGKIKDPDDHIAKAIAYIGKDLAQYDARKGQLKEQYEVEYPY